MSDFEQAHVLAEALKGQTITSAYVHADDEGGFEWIGLTLANGAEIELSAHGMHTEGWIVAERGRRIRDIYGVPS